MRRRLLLWSAPVTIVVLLVLIKLWTVVIAGGAARADFAAGDQDALGGDVDVLTTINVIEPERAFFASGALAVLEGRLPDADRDFSLALAGTDQDRSCPVRINLELVRETLGDRAVGASDPEAALRGYRAALDAVTGAPSGCFAGSTDPDEQRRVAVDGAAVRLTDKIDALDTLPVAPPPPPPPRVVAPPPRLPPVGSTAPDEQRRLNPDTGDPLERLQQILRDAASGG